MSYITYFCSLGSIVTGLMYLKSIIFQPTYSNITGTVTKDGINYFYLDNRSDITLFISSGNTGNSIFLCNLFSLFPYNICTYDYINFGNSKCDFGGIYLMKDDSLVQSAHSVLNDLKSKNSLTKKIVFIGYSLGSYPSTVIASEYEKKSEYQTKLILITPFDKLSSFNYILNYLDFFFGRFDNLSFAENINQPTLIINALYDEVVPSFSSCALHRKFKNSTILNVHTNHSNWYLYDIDKQFNKQNIHPELFDKILTFINK